MFDLFYIRHFLNGLVVAGAQPVHKLIFLATGLNADNDLIALFPFMDILGDHLNRILEICYHLNNAVSCYLEHAIIRRVKLTEISCIKNSLDPWIFLTQSTDHIPCSVCGVIINKYKFIIILRQFLL